MNTRHRILAALVSWLLIGLGVTLQTTPVTAQTSATQPAATQPAATQPDSGIKFIEVKSAGRNGNASVTVQVAANAVCSISYTTPKGTKSEAMGLADKTASADGRVSWVWVIGPRTQAGTGSVTVTCNGQSASTDIIIK
jgi:hypothetical protein